MKIGNNIRVVYFKNGKYYEKMGRVAKLNYDTRMIQVVMDNISFKNIVELEIIA